MITTIRRRGEFALACGTAVAMLVGMLWFAAFQPGAADYPTTAAALAVLWAGLWPGLLPALNARLVVTTRGLEVTNYYTRHWVPFAAVSWVQRTDEVVLHLVGGPRLKVAAGAWSVASRLRGDSVQREIADRIERARDAARAEPDADTAVRREFVLQPYPALAILVVVEGVALARHLIAG
ncbi:hypothetical protein BJP25_16945 [Actinokineospora bangkokensis]|uniref:PH domain-containing protein n=1 Tax=Actinokineospora bangkokensis TaxID=1193682 RepID=A0A1Q9LMG4_9PSEU|nr:hypothetical protein BJP25_16945 [Actinokineospora bangkokensis]